MSGHRPPAVLLCGGLGLRQRTDGDDLPKPLRPLPDGRGLLLHVMDHYRAYGVDEFVLCVGYAGAAILDAVRAAFGVAADALTEGTGWTAMESGGTAITVVDSGVHAGKCARLLDARRHVGDRRFLLGYGDVLSDVDFGTLLKVHDEGGGTLTLTTATARSRYGVVTFGEGTLVAGFDEKPERPDAVSAGYFACEPELFDSLAVGRSLEREVVPELVRAGRVHALRHTGYWKALDTYKDFVELASPGRGGAPGPTT